MRWGVQVASQMCRHEWQWQALSIKYSGQLDQYSEPGSGAVGRNLHKSAIFHSTNKSNFRLTCQLKNFFQAVATLMAFVGVDLGSAMCLLVGMIAFNVQVRRGLCAGIHDCLESS